jgi:outer membrane protein OmpA-like peptidoglycan-associated protein
MALLRAAARAKKDEAEKPFWISFSDLMTGLMVLFLVAMAVAILAVTEQIRKQGAAEKARADAVEGCITSVEDVSRAFRGVTIHDHSIDFGTQAEFSLDKADLTPDQETFLRNFVPHVIAITKRPACKAWLKRVVVDGYASQEGTYLHNLDLSIRRSERVLCVLLDPRVAQPIDEGDRLLIQKLFFVGGSSFNSLKEGAAESRRIELKIEFYGLGESRDNNSPAAHLSDEFACPVDHR